MIRKLLLFLLLLLAACAPTGSKPPPVILASTSFLADIAQNVAGSRLEVASLLPPGVDPHSYQPTPRDIARIADSQILVINGAEYERFIESMLENAGGERTIIVASAGLSPRAEDRDGHSPDPHFWLDPNHVIRYVENIRDALSELDPEGADLFQSNAAVYIQQLQTLDTWITEQVETLPAENRLLVTNHESLEYFADRYGFTVLGSVVPGTSSDAAPSAQEMATLIDQVQGSGARAIFLDAVDNPGLAQQIASQTGVSVVTDLNIESLTDGPPAPTYIDMMRHNVTRIVEALR